MVKLGLSCFDALLNSAGATLICSCVTDAVEEVFPPIFGQRSISVFLISFSRRLLFSFDALTVFPNPPITSPSEHNLYKTMLTTLWCIPPKDSVARFKLSAAILPGGGGGAC